jgi:hypothetical protein
VGKAWPPVFRPVEPAPAKSPASPSPSAPGVDRLWPQFELLLVIAPTTALRADRGFVTARLPLALPQTVGEPRQLHPVQLDGLRRGFR